MEVVDVGSRPADEVLELLFEGQALKSLLRGYGAACFTLVRPTAAPRFFRELIENAAMLDATTRQHVAFVVFYGDRSGVVREGNLGYDPVIRRERIAGLRVRLEGLSISGDPDHFSDFAVQPTVPPKRRSERGKHQDVHSLFSEKLGQLLRSSPQDVNQHLLAHHMSRVATRLIELYQISESLLPCLLFTDGKDLKNHLVVQLDPDDPLQSLYAHVLTPLSEQFSDLSNFWDRRDSLPWKKDAANQAMKKAALLRDKINSITDDVDRQRVVIPERIQALENSIGELRKAQRNRIVTALCNSEIQDTKIVELADELAAISGGERRFRSDAQMELEIARLQKRLFRERQRVTAHTKINFDDETSQIRELKETVLQLVKHCPALEEKRRAFESELAREQKIIEDYSPEKVEQERVSIQKAENALKTTGYGKETLEASTPSAFAAIEVMYRRELLGLPRINPPRLLPPPMRILFLAANPTATSRLDLEEELRSIEAELRGVRFRDQVVLTARHAIRPDDLVRYIRSDCPTVVHFSGHGSQRGVVLRNDESGVSEVTGTSLHRFFLNRDVKLVVLNACCTKEHAMHLLGAVSTVIGTTSSVGDIAARRFAVAFYRALGEGYSIAEAFRDGGDSVVLDNKEDVFWAQGSLDQLLVVPK